jgi:hypothetical protein
LRNRKAAQLLRICGARLGERATYEDDFEKHLLVDLHELLVPLVDVGSLATGVVVLITSAWGVVLVVFAPLDDLLQDRLVDLASHKSVRDRWKCLFTGRDNQTHIGNGDGFSGFTQILKHVLDQDGALGDLTFCWMEVMVSVWIEKMHVPTVG